MRHSKIFAIILAFFSLYFVYGHGGGETKGLCGVALSNTVLVDHPGGAVPTLYPMDLDLARRLFSFSSFPEIGRAYQDNALLMADDLSGWRKSSYQNLLKLSDVDFRNVLQDMMSIYRNDQQFRSESRRRYLAAVDAWLEAKHQDIEGAAKKFQDILLNEFVGKSQQTDGYDFQPIQADFRNMMAIVREDDYRAAIPRAAIPLILTAFMKRNFPNAAELAHGGEGSLNHYISQFMQ